VLAAWNGLAIAALAEASRLEDGEGYREAAVLAADAVLAGLRGADGRLRRSWKDGRATGSGVLEDYTHLADGLLALYDATFDERWFTIAVELMETVLARFGDPEGGFYDTADDHERLVSRPRDVQDNAVQSGSSMATAVLLRLAALTGEGRYRTAAERALQTVTAFVARYPAGFAGWLSAIDLALAPVAEIAIVGDPTAPETIRLVAPARRGFRPNQVLAVGAEAAASAIPLLAGRFALNGRPTAFVCHDFACRQPVHEPEALAALLADLAPPPAGLASPGGG
jgi:uncharacterized protein